MTFPSGTVHLCTTVAIIYYGVPTKPVLFLYTNSAKGHGGWGGGVRPLEEEMQEAPLCSELKC